MKYLSVLYRFLRILVHSSVGQIRFMVFVLVEICKFGDYRFKYQGRRDGSAYILSNGPSLMKEIETLKNQDEFILADKFVPNYFAESDIFDQLKPHFYCLADPAFFSNCITDRTKHLYETLDKKVSWPMELYVPNWGLIYIKPYINNDHIIIKSVSPIMYAGFERMRFPIYKVGLASPSFVNVVIMMEFVFLNLGYKKLYLCGVDHTHFVNLAVNDNNQLCIKQDHFYGEGVMKVMPPRYNGDVWRIKDIIYNTYLTFAEHDVMRGYADYIGAEIINYTKVSWIDSYIRLSQLEKDNKQDQA